MNRILIAAGCFAAAMIALCVLWPTPIDSQTQNDVVASAPAELAILEQAPVPAPEPNQTKKYGKFMYDFETLNKTTVNKN